MNKKYSYFLRNFLYVLQKLYVEKIKWLSHQKTKTADTSKKTKDDLDAMLDQASVDRDTDSLFDEDEEAIERLLLGPDFAAKATSKQVIDDNIDAILNSAQAVSVDAEVPKSVQVDAEQHIDALLDKFAEDVDAMSAPNAMDDYLDTLNDHAQELLTNTIATESDVLDYALDKSLALRDAPLDVESLKEFFSGAVIPHSKADVDALDLLLDQHSGSSAPKTESIEKVIVSESAPSSSLVGDAEAMSADAEIAQAATPLSDVTAETAPSAAQIMTAENALDFLVNDFDLEVAEGEENQSLVELEAENTDATGVDVAIDTKTVIVAPEESALEVETPVTHAQTSPVVPSAGPSLVTDLSVDLETATVAAVDQASEAEEPLGTLERDTVENTVAQATEIDATTENDTSERNSHLAETELDFPDEIVAEVQPFLDAEVSVAQETLPEITAPVIELPATDATLADLETMASEMLAEPVSKTDGEVIASDDAVDLPALEQGDTAPAIDLTEAVSDIEASVATSEEASEPRLVVESEALHAQSAESQFDAPTIVDGLLAEAQPQTVSNTHSQPELGSLSTTQDLLDNSQTTAEELDLDVAFEPESENVAASTELTDIDLDHQSSAADDLTDIQDTIVAESEQPKTVDPVSKSDYLMADFDISSDDFNDIVSINQPLDTETIANVTELTTESISETEEIDEFADDFDSTADLALDAALAEDDIVPELHSEHELQINQAPDSVDPALLGQITSLWAAHELLKQQLSSATPPAANEYLADELEMLEKEQKILRRSIDSNSKKIPSITYVALGLGIVGLLLGGSLLTMKLMDAEQVETLVEQNAELQKELDTLKQSGTSSNTEAINTTLADVTAKLDALEKQTQEHNPMPVIEELQASVNELKAGSGSKNEHAAEPAQPVVETPAPKAAEAKVEVVKSEAVKPDVVKAEIVKAEVVKPAPAPMPPSADVSKPSIPKVLPVKVEHIKVVTKPKKIPPKVEPNAKVIASVDKTEKIEAPKPNPVDAEESSQVTSRSQPAGRWVANLVSFRQDWYAQGKAAEFARRGVYVQIIPVQIKGETWYRLRSSTFANRAEAMNFAGKAKRQLNLTSVWVTED